MKITTEQVSLSCPVNLWDLSASHPSTLTPNAPWFHWYVPPFVSPFPSIRAPSVYSPSFRLFAAFTWMWPQSDRRSLHISSSDLFWYARSEGSRCQRCEEASWNGFFSYSLSPASKPNLSFLHRFKLKKCWKVDFITIRQSQANGFPQFSS